MIESWSDAPPREVLALLQHEYTRWSADLGWDLARDWAAVEPARRAGLLSGWIARGAKGEPRGWAFGVDQPGVMQIGALVAADAATAAQLVGEAAGDRRRDTLVFVRSSAVVTPAQFAAAGFSVQPYAYLVAPTLIRAEPNTSLSLSPWSSADLDDTAALFARAYAADDALRPFARHNTMPEWLDYVESVTLRPGCGVFSPDASVTVRQHGELIAVALVTSVGATTSHLAQLAVAPEQRGRGLSRVVLSAVRHNGARVLKTSRCSLLVSEANVVARALYAQAGFRPAGEFIAACRQAHPSQPLRFISTAPATGGASALR